MKYLLLLLPVFSFGQDSKIDSTTKEFFLDSVINVTGSQEEIFNKEKLWMTKVLAVPNNGNQIIDNDLKMASSIGTFEFTAYYYEYKRKQEVKSSSQYMYKGRVKLKLFAKEGKAKISIGGYEYQKNYLYPSDYKFYDLTPEELKEVDNPDKFLRHYQINLKEIQIAMETYIHSLMKNFSEYISKKAENDF